MQSWLKWWMVDDGHRIRRPALPTIVVLLGNVLGSGANASGNGSFCGCARLQRFRVSLGPAPPVAPVSVAVAEEAALALRSADEARRGVPQGKGAPPNTSFVAAGRARCGLLWYPVKRITAASGRAVAAADVASLPAAELPLTVACGAPAAPRYAAVLADSIGGEALDELHFKAAEPAPKALKKLSAAFVDLEPRPLEPASCVYPHWKPMLRFKSTPSVIWSSALRRLHVRSPFFRFIPPPLGHLFTRRGVKSPCSTRRNHDNDGSLRSFHAHPSGLRLGRKRSLRRESNSAAPVHGWGCEEE